MDTFTINIKVNKVIKREDKTREILEFEPYQENNYTYPDTEKGNKEAFKFLTDDLKRFKMTLDPDITNNNLNAIRNDRLWSEVKKRSAELRKNNTQRHGIDFHRTITITHHYAPKQEAIIA